MERKEWKGKEERVVDSKKPFFIQTLYYFYSVKKVGFETDTTTITAAAAAAAGRGRGDDKEGDGLVSLQSHVFKEIIFILELENKIGFKFFF